MSCEVTCPPAPVCTEPLQVQVVGLMRDPAFHMATWVAQTLRLSFPSNFAEPLVNPLLEFSWNEFLQEKKKNAFVYMDISIGDEPAGRLLFELFCKMCPKTCQNFQALCTSPAGTSSTDLELNYKGTIFHRIVKKGWIQGGGIPCGIGDENESIFGGVFEDESFAIPHNKRGVLGMANKGHHSNGSQFYITLQATPYMDRKYVAFGQLIEGSEVLQKLEALPTINERPRSRCLVADCGIYIP